MPSCGKCTAHGVLLEDYSIVTYISIAMNWTEVTAIIKRDALHECRISVSASVVALGSPSVCDDLTQE
jgi:hypothetical protein